MSRLRELLNLWRTDAEILQKYGAHEQAKICRQHAAAVEEVLAQSGQDTLNLTEAARESGYSSDHLGRLVREGKIPNAGRKNAPRIRRSDLPRKASHLPTEDRSLQLVGHNRRQIAQAVANSD